MSSSSGPSVRPQRIAPTGSVDVLRDPTAPLRHGVLSSSLGAVSVCVAPIVGVTSGAGSGSLPGILFVVFCTLVVPVLAFLSLVRGRVGFGGALLAGSGAVAVGFAVIDVQLLTGTIDANRLELFRPLSAAVLDPGAGAYLVLVGHVLIALAGVGGLVAVGRASLLDGYGDAGSAAGRIGGWAATLAAVATVVLAGALFAPPFDSADPVFLVATVVDGPTLLAVGSALMAVAALAVVGAGLSSVSTSAASGALIGTAVAALGLVGTRWISAATTQDRIGSGVGSIAATAAATVLLVVGLSVPALAHRTRDAPSVKPIAAPAAKMGKSARARAAAEAAATARARSTRRHAIAGATGVAAGVLLAAGALLPLLRVPDGLAEPNILGARIAVLGAVVLVLLSVTLFFSELAPSVRPTVGVFWVAAVMCATPVLQALVLALGVPEVRMGSGAVLIGVGVVVTGVTGVLLWVAGSAEREDVDTSIDQSPSQATVWTGALGALVSVVALGLPLYTSDETAAATFAEFPWGWDAWGQALFGVAVVVTVIVAARARPARGAALLWGAAAGMAVHIAGWPLLEVRGGASGPGAGALAGAVGAAMLVAAGVARRRTRR
ncbi:hypothetical protein [Rhodococcoides trifolii]|uniref:hypothetical protein n=1 Tax=Rhodococcoides trifolii TaxID=908250 RepID=UPI00166A27DB|nr:hypothetical protein [Rhodococcus trifolii]